MSNANLFIISKYGLKAVGYSFGLFGLFYIFGFSFFAFLAFMVFASLLFAYRNPERELRVFEQASILSPCDGIVDAIEEINEDGYRYRIVIESSFVDVGLLRMPAGGKIVKVKTCHGTKLGKNTTQFTKLNAMCSYTVQTEDKHNTLEVQHRLKQTPLSLACELKEGDELYKSKRYGFANNTVTTLSLPENVRLNVQEGEKLKAGESLIAYFS